MRLRVTTRCAWAPSMAEAFEKSRPMITAAGYAAVITAVIAAVLAKIAIDLERALVRRRERGGPGYPEARNLAHGDAGVPPHQYILRLRLRHAATRLAVEPGNVLDISFDTGFGDVSNFNRAFRAEFGVSPRLYRRGANTGWYTSRLTGEPGKGHR
jgi:methylphosphotriester-DNA--protein-cysteine methyltransferase